MQFWNGKYPVRDLRHNFDKLAIPAFLQRDKDGDHTIRSAIPEIVLLYANVTSLSP